MAGRSIRRKLRADMLADRALDFLVARPREQVTLELVAKSAGLTFWQAFRIFDNAETMYRIAANRLARRIEEAFHPIARPARSVEEAIRGYAFRAAGLVAGEDYRQLLYLTLRDGCSCPWLAELYRIRVAGAIKHGLEEAIREVGLRLGTVVLVQPGAPEKFLASLELALVLPKLLPDRVEPGSDEIREAVEAVARRTIAATYAVGLEAQAA